MTRPAAFFDVDGTLLDRNLSPYYMRFLYRRQLAGLREVLSVISWTARYKLALADVVRMAEEVARALGGRFEAETERLVREWFETEVVHYLRPVAAVVVERHRAMGHEVILLTGWTRHLAALVADHLDVPHVLCSELEVADGRFTGRPVRPVCFGFGKVIRAEAFARDNAIDLGRSTFYTDSYTDLTMLLRVGNPRPVNPDIRLRLHARRAGWPVEQW